MPNCTNQEITVAELECRWQRVLESTRTAVAHHPDCYRELKRRVAEIVDHPLDIREYMPAVEKVLDLLKALDPHERGSIFDHFFHRLKPSSIWQVTLLRVECKDLQAYLKVFEDWRMASIRLKIVK